MDTANLIGQIMRRSRLAQDLTQDQYAEKYQLSGPVVFKFERGYLRPKRETWLAMADNAGLTQRRAVAVWLKAKLPPEYRHHVQLQAAVEPAPKRKAQTDYARISDRAQLRLTAAADQQLPSGLRELLADDERWALYKPTGAEINRLRDIFSRLGQGTSDHYRRALRLVREFS